nr:hypothetical protein [Tanacetum cinerariifolium]
MDDLNITMEEYIRLEEEKARRNGKVHNWETATYGKIWYDEDVYDLRSIKNEFPAIVFDDAFTSEVTPSYEPMVSPLNDNKIDFKISFDESNNEDYTVIYDKNSFSYKIISVNDLKTDLENDNDKVKRPSFPPPEPEVSFSNDLDFFKDFEKEFLAIVYNDSLTSKSDFSTEPTLCPQHIDEFNSKDDTSLSECDENEQNVLYFNNLFPFNIIYPDDLKSDKNNDNGEIDIEQPSQDMSIIPLLNESLVKTKQKGAILELKRRHLKNIIFCYYTSYPAMKIRCISASSAQEMRNDQIPIRRITLHNTSKFTQYAVSHIQDSKLSFRYASESLNHQVDYQTYRRSKKVRKEPQDHRKTLVIFAQPNTRSIEVMAILVISISLDSSEDSVGTPAGRVILFGTIPITIFDTTPVIAPPTTQTDTIVIPIETPIIAPTIPPSPDYTPASTDYSPASETESDPYKDPSSGHIQLLPAISPFLSSDDDTTDSDTPDTTPSPTQHTPFTEITASIQRFPVIPHSSSRHSLSDHSSPNLPSTSAGPSRKRRRVRDIGYLADVEVSSRETIVERVTHPAMPEDIPEPAQEGAAEVTYETLEDLVQRFHDHTQAILVHRIQAIEGVQMEQGHKIVGVKSAVTDLTETELEMDNRRLRGTESVESQRVDRL